MKLQLTENFKQKARKLTKKDHHLNSSLKRQFDKFQSNPNHPSLRLHKLKGKRSEQFAIWIKKDLRALCIRSKTQKETYIFFNIVTHDEY